MYVHSKNDYKLNRDWMNEIDFMKTGLVNNSPQLTGHCARTIEAQNILAFFLKSGNFLSVKNTPKVQFLQIPFNTAERLMDTNLKTSISTLLTHIME